MTNYSVKYGIEMDCIGEILSPLGEYFVTAQSPEQITAAFEQATGAGKYLIQVDEVMPLTLQEFIDDIKTMEEQ